MTALEALIKVLKEGTNSIGNWEEVTAAVAPLDDSDTSNAVRVRSTGSAAEAIRDAVLQASDGGHNAILFPPGDWYVDPDDLALPDEEGFVAAIPSGFRVLGLPGSRIIQQGLGSSPSGFSPFYHIFRVQDGQSNIIFDGLTIEGEKPAASYTYNHQSTGIDIWLTNTKDVLVRNCRFLNLWGFSIHDRGGNERIHAINNFTYRCANGINICADYSLQMHNILVESEGFEGGGAYSSICYNKLYNCLGVGISAGGNLNTFKGGSRIDFNTIVGCQAVEGQYGSGIIAAENFGRSSISSNYIANCALHGIITAAHAGTKELSICDNRVYSNGATGAGGVGILVYDGGGRHDICRNKSRDLAQAGYQQYYGMILFDDDCRVQDNDFNGTNHDATYSGANRTLESNNRYETNDVEVSSSDFLDADYSWRPP